MDALRQDKHYTYADYLTWGDEVRYELIDGVPYLLAAPGTAHQRVSREIFKHLAVFLTGKPCEVFSAPYDVRLNAHEGDDTVVQPDILVVCDKSKLDDKGCVGAPDMVIEILSPTNESHDRLVKFNQYLRAGVREYWIVSPDSKLVSVHILRDRQYVTMAYGETNTVPVHVLDGCTIEFSDIFVESLIKWGGVTHENLYTLRLLRHPEHRGRRPGGDRLRVGTAQPQPGRAVVRRPARPHRRDPVCL